MWRTAVVLLCSATGCVTTRSDIHTIGPLVTSIQARPGGLAVETCAMSRVQETKQECVTPLIGAFFLTPTGGTSWSTDELRRIGCSTTIVPTRPTR